MRNGTVTPWIGVRADWPLHGPNPLDHLVSVTPADLATHGLVLGATGSGKTTLLHHLIAQDLERGNSLVVLDYRGDLVSAVLELCASRISPERVKVIDLREKERPLGFNPLLGAGEPYFRALNVLDVLASEAESWGVQLAEYLRNSLLLLAETQSSLVDLERIFFDPDFLRSLLHLAQTDSLTAFWSRFLELSPDKQAALASPVHNKMSLLLATPALRRMLGHSKPFDLGRHLDTAGSVLLVSLAVDETHAAGRMLGNLVLAAISREIFARVSRSEGSRNPVRLVVDEFEHFNSDLFEHLLAEGRRFKCPLLLANQVLAQLSPRFRSMLLNNVGLKALFRTGREDSAVLSRDIFGDPRAYNFSELPTGYCVLWQKNKGWIEIEVNAPLLEHIGRLSTDGAEFRRCVFEQVPKCGISAPRPRPLPQRRPEPAPSPGPQNYPASLPPRVPPRNLVANLEDWLCG